MDKKECPDCESFDTERKNTEFYVEYVETIRTCVCGAVFTNVFTLDHKR